MIPAPRIDRRTAIHVEGQLRTLLAAYAADWDGDDAMPEWKGVPGAFGDALVRIFARYAEIVIERLNRTLDKNLLAFLDMLGESLLPPQPARVPLTFSLSTGAAADGVVPVATQVAAKPGEGQSAPLLFETERELTVVAAALDAIFVSDPDTDAFTDLSPSALTSAERRAFTGAVAADHSLYVGLDDLLGRDDLRELSLDVTVAAGPAQRDPREVQWSIVGSAEGAAIADGTAGLANSGQLRIVFPKPPNAPRRSVNGQQSRWLRGHLATKIARPDPIAKQDPTAQQEQQPGRVRAAHLLKISGLAVTAVLGGTGVPVDRAFANAAPLDTTKDFLPFGERPKIGDTLYLSAGDAFGMAGTAVTVTVVPSAGTKPNAAGKRTLIWEYWDGERWTALVFKDGTAALTNPDKGEVTFELGPHPTLVTVNGAERYWIRVRIASGDYGREAGYLPDPDPAKGYHYVPSSLAPPSIARISVDYALTRRGLLPDAVLAYNNLSYDPIVGYPFAPFRPIPDAVRTLYLGFALPTARSFPDRPVSLFLDLDEPLSNRVPDDPSPATAPRLVWECWAADEWRRPGLRNDTHGLTHSGVLEFLAPPGFAERPAFGVARYWLRCRLEAGAFAFAPRLRRVLLNTVMAEHATTIRDEMLGSSDGGQGQRFVTAYHPVLDDQELRVREPDLPPADERNATGGDDAIIVTRNAGGRPTEIWVRWREVPDFYGSGPRDRHYVLDHLTGTVIFGDGMNGLIPPPGAGNLRLARYRTGGGSAGNCATGAVAQLKTSIPYVDSVANPAPARGGADAETIASLRERGPRAIRHRDRAVTIEDYEDLAMLASPEVARAKCVPLRDLSLDPDGARMRLGVVSVVIVPRAAHAKPLPSLVLLERVANHLDARRLPVVDLRVVGPDYVRVDIATEVAVTAIDRAADVRSRVIEALTGFLHPLTGGFDGAGWDFGRRPYDSDLLRCISAVPGVDHVNALTVTDKPDRDGSTKALALVYVGSLNITVTAGR